MSNEIATLDQNPMSEIENTNKIMQALMRLPHYKKMGEDVVFAIVAKARSLNMDPMYALNGGLFNIKGKIGMPAEAMAAMIREKGHSIQKDKASTDTCCILHGKRKDNGDTWTCKFSIEDAKKAGIYAQTWEKYGAAMCYNRAMSFLARQLFPDIIKGAGYTMDELKEIAKVENYQQPAPEIEVEFEEVKNPITSDQADQLADALALCDTAYLEKMWKSLNSLNPPVRDLKDIPSEIFDRLMSAAIKNRKTVQIDKSNTDSDESKPDLHNL